MMKKTKKQLSNEDIQLITSLEKYGWGGALSSGLKYAGIGASMGSLIEPGLGTAIGAGVGALAGGVYGYIQEDNAINRKNIQDQKNMVLAKKQSFNINDLGYGNWRPEIMADGGKISEYSGQTHSGPNGGIPVDAQGRPSAMSKQPTVALAENGEVSFNGYIFSNRLKDKKNKTFADAAKRILSKYKVRLGDNYSGNDKLAQAALKQELDGIKQKNETARIKDTYTKGDLQKFGFGGTIENTPNDFFKHYTPDITGSNVKDFLYNGIPKSLVALGSLVDGNQRTESNFNNPNEFSKLNDLFNNKSSKPTILNPLNTNTVTDNPITNPTSISNPDNSIPNSQSNNNDFYSNVLTDTSYSHNFSGINGFIDPASTTVPISDSPTIDSLPSVNNPKDYISPMDKTKGSGVDATGAIVSSLGALSNIARGTLEKAYTQNPESYMINGRYSPVLMRDNAAEIAANNASADRSRIARSMSPTQAATYQQVSEASSQDRLARLRERIFNINASQLNRAQAENIAIDEQNAKIRMGIDNSNQANIAAKENLVTTGIGQLGSIAQGYAKDRNAKSQIDQYAKIMKETQNRTNIYLEKLMKVATPNAEKKMVVTQIPTPSPTPVTPKAVIKEQPVQNKPVVTNVPTINNPSSIDLAVQNNNPGNIRDKSGNFIKYDNPETGRSAMLSDIKAKLSGNSGAVRSKFGRNAKTLKDVIATYAPSPENNVGDYMKSIEKTTGYKSDTPVSNIDLNTLVKAMILHESKQMYDKLYGGIK